MHRQLLSIAGLTAMIAPVWGQVDRESFFSEPLPSIGKSIPEIGVYAEDGHVVSTASLRGSYTVLVFGCLT